MEAHHIVAGFSEIKVEFIKKTRTSKTLEELQLWFTFEENVLYAHDASEHDINIAVAIYSPVGNSWRSFLRRGGYGEKLVESLIKFTPQNEVAAEFNQQYKLNGFIPFRGA